MMYAVRIQWSQTDHDWVLVQEASSLKAAVEIVAKNTKGALGGFYGHKIDRVFNYDSKY